MVVPLGSPAAGDQRLSEALLALVEKQQVEHQQREETLWREMVAQRDETVRDLREEVKQLRMEIRTSAASATATATATATAAEVAASPGQAAAISDGQLTQLQVRIEALRGGKHLSEEGCDTLEDVVADYVDLCAGVGGALVITAELAHAPPYAAAGKARRLVQLSEAMESDSGFARQVQRLKMC